MQLQFFPSRRLAIYMARAFLVRSFAVLAMLALVLMTLDLLGESGDILAVPGNGEAELWHYVGLRLPQIIATFLPFSVLLGTLITLATMNQHSEIVMMKAAGLSAHQILAPLIAAAAAIAVLSFTFNERIVTRASAAFDAWKAVGYGEIPKDTGLKTNIWVREGNNLITAGTVSGRGSAVKLSQIEIFHRVDNHLVDIVRAPRGYYDPARQDWVLEDARRFDVTSGASTRLGTIRNGKGIRPDQFTLAKVDADALGFMALRQAIADLRDAGRPTGSLEASLWHKIARPLSSLLMPLLGSVAAFGLARSGHLFIRAVIGMSLGFAYFVADNFALAMGNIGAYPPLLAAWAPFLLFLMLGEAVLIRTEE
ncbi:LPS export ABC transporter permease LptG [Sphingobium fluviale]|uniref:LPS export ABC transporter permease LptG n=1 Tax=Sphingobium fluviale TaxID=2506423 RepID=A0A4Q1KHL8_9SPHN|nr:LPS export ABC transporter permease LptG [Sphingobium fluviale]RXR29012.1 LPS export ABC transporter permease LptG [Sphingobium fluviale]